MKKKTITQLILSLFVALMISSTGSAQDITQNDTYRQMEMAAKERAQKWEEELSLRAKQMLLMEKKFVEFDIKRDKLMSADASKEEKLERLKNLRILELRELRDILTKPQYDRYLMLLEQEAIRSESGG
jgi:hypothetical protein